eukprot:CAMPEP_0175075754 /NCGR_PEP_ID=MMETSP0052_2-20121109/22245_1 /TAXON_ID=51329 ORGANISM="Polytomella parva, Strain SAG 63-3" /NCGR_SAMPLE_ID=MMETSP0052_2 /ASSEMBLY_ACC=CAM_ASM_000194 /LENGTH=123 /DNA_ID=CAMNT_0016344613 /DNA_START=172 /DNA_END=540 /DNA_ORIENTATION=-
MEKDISDDDLLNLVDEGYDACISELPKLPKPEECLSNVAEPSLLSSYALNNNARVADHHNNDYEDGFDDEDILFAVDAAMHRAYEEEEKRDLQKLLQTDNLDSVKSETLGMSLRKSVRMEEEE